MFFHFSLLQSNCPWHCVAKCAGELLKCSQKNVLKNVYKENVLRPTEFYFRYHCFQVFRDTKNVWIVGHLDYFHLLVFTCYNKHGVLHSSSSANIIVWTKLIILILWMSAVSFWDLKLPKGRLKKKPVFSQTEFIHGIEPTKLATHLLPPCVSSVAPSSQSSDMLV